MFQFTKILTFISSTAAAATTSNPIKIIGKKIESCVSEKNRLKREIEEKKAETSRLSEKVCEINENKRGNRKPRFTDYEQISGIRGLEKQHQGSVK